MYVGEIAIQRTDSSPMALGGDGSGDEAATGSTGDINNASAKTL